MVKIERKEYEWGEEVGGGGGGGGGEYL
jgi:hypothetical protein